MNALEAASLVMIPSGYENGTLGSLKPTDGTGDFTFSRGSDISATRVNEDGLIEKGYDNLLLQSNQFDTTWATSGTLTSGQTGYDGSSDAWLFESPSTFMNIAQSVSISEVQTYSVYAKAGTTDWLQLRLVGSSTIYAFFDLNPSTTGSRIGAKTGQIDASIEDVGNGWFRCSLVADIAASAARIYIARNNSTSINVGDNIYIQDAMLNQGLVAYPYVETTTAPVAGGILEDMPRLDYSGSCPALLLEPQRTNLAEKSEYIGGWSFPTNVTLTQNYGISPEGLTNSTRLQFTSNGFMNDALSQVSGTQYTLSIYAKRNDGGTQSFGFYVDGTPTIVGGITLTSDWQRFTYTYTASNSFSIGLAGNSGADVSVYGFQLEQDATYPTSYIPTYGTSQTRLRDSATASVTNTTSRTYFLDGKRLADASFQTSSNFYGPNDELGITFWNVNRIRFRFGGGLNSYYTLVGDDFKIAISYDGTDSKVFVNGVYFTTQTLDLGNLTSIVISGNNGAVSYNQTLLFPTALSDDECIELTTI